MNTNMYVVKESDRKGVIVAAITEDRRKAKRLARKYKSLVEVRHYNRGV